MKQLEVFTYYATSVITIMIINRAGLDKFDPLSFLYFIGLLTNLIVNINNTYSQAKIKIYSAHKL